MERLFLLLIYLVGAIVALLMLPFSIVRKLRKKPFYAYSAADLPTKHTGTLRENAKDFVTSLIKLEFSSAHALLTLGCREQITAKDLENSYLSLLSKYEDVDGIEISLIDVREDYQSKLPNELGSAYVAISGSEVCDAVEVRFVMDRGNIGIGEISWGRP